MRVEEEEKGCSSQSSWRKTGGAGINKRQKVVAPFEHGNYPRPRRGAPVHFSGLRASRKPVISYVQLLRRPNALRVAPARQHAVD